MTEKINSPAGFFLAGLAVGSLIGILFAPKSGEGTRGYLLKKLNEGRKHARKKAQEMRQRTEDLVERGKEMINETKEQIAEKLDEADTSHLPGKSKAKGA